MGPGYSPIPERLVTQIKAGQFIDLADLLPESVKAQDSEPQTYLDGKLLVSTKKRVREISDIVTWVEAFTVYMWIFCCIHPSRWQDMTQCKLLILQTARLFSGKSWLHYDTAFRKDAAASGLNDWSRMNSDLYHFHTRLPQKQQFQPPTFLSSPSRSMASWSIFYRSWNNCSCAWPYGQCRYCHRCEKCEGEHPLSTAPLGPQHRLLSAHGPLALHGANARGIETVTRLSTSPENNVNSVQFHFHVVCFPFLLLLLRLLHLFC